MKRTELLAKSRYAARQRDVGDRRRCDRFAHLLEQNLDHSRKVGCRDLAIGGLRAGLNVRPAWLRI
jgi:hypothetical protein